MGELTTRDGIDVGFFVCVDEGPDVGDSGTVGAGPVGPIVGDSAVAVGPKVGTLVFVSVGTNVGAPVGGIAVTVGPLEGLRIGEDVGERTGALVGMRDGLGIGFEVGERTGALVGMRDGLGVGFVVGEATCRAQKSFSNGEYTTSPFAVTVGGVSPDARAVTVAITPIRKPFTRFPSPSHVLQRVPMSRARATASALVLSSRR